MSWFGAIRRRVEADLRQSRDVLQEQASLLSLTHDVVYVRDMKGVIRYWNRGAEVLYGWPSEQALGKISHELLKAVFPLPLEEIEAELLCSGRWEGELVKTHRDGTQLVVASRWSLKRDDRGAQSSQCDQPVSASHLKHQAAGAGQTGTCDPPGWIAIEEQVPSDPVVPLGIAFSPAHNTLWSPRRVELGCARSLFGPKWTQIFSCGSCK